MSSDLKAIFDPNVKTIQGIFGDTESYYYVPDYQRPYDWNSEQVEQLFDDVYESMSSNEETYFLGPIIVIKTANGLEIVDGQQRLTTLTILFCVLRDFYNPEDKVLHNSVRSLIDNKYRLRLITQAHKQNQFEHEILEKVVIPETEITLKERENNKFLNTVLVFKEKLKDLTEEELNAFTEYLFKKVAMISITCTNQSYAIILFRTLNARGLDLSPADLIKSSLISKCDEEKKSQFISTWNQIDELSSQMDESIENLLTYYEYYLLGTNPKKSLYEELEANFKGKDPNTVIFDFKKFVEAYKDVNTTETKLLYSFYYLPNQVYWKSILTTAKSENFAEFEGLARLLRKMYYYNWIAGYTTSKTKQLSFRIIQWIKDKKPFDYIKEKIDSKLSDESLLRRIIESLNGDAYGEPWLKPLLILIEYEQTDDSKITLIEKDNKLHVDHILPSKWSSNKEWKKLWDEENARKWVNKMGNLTLLSGKKNIALQNDPPLKKKEMYEKGYGGKTAFEISKKIIDVIKENSWVVEEVERRQKWLVKQVKKIFEAEL